MIGLVFSAGTAVFATRAAAEEFTATATVTAGSETHQVAAGLMAIDIAAACEAMEVGSDSDALAGSTGECFGSMTVLQGEVGGSGHCVCEVEDGDRWIDRFTYEEMTEGGKVAGSWEVAGGTGRWEGLTGRGAFETAVDREQGTFTNVISDRAGAIRPEVSDGEGTKRSEGTGAHSVSSSRQR